MKKSFLMSVVLVFAVSCGSSKDERSGYFSTILPAALTKAAEVGDLEAHLVAVRDGRTEEAVLTIEGGRVSGSLSLKRGTWVLELDFYQMAPSGNLLPIAFILFGSREIGKGVLVLTYELGDIRYIDSPSNGISPSLSPSVPIVDTCLFRFDCDGDGFSNFEELRVGSNPEDPNSVPNIITSNPDTSPPETGAVIPVVIELPTITVSLTEGEVVKDRVAVRADGASPFGVKSLVLTAPAGLADENSAPDVFITTWDTTTFPEDGETTFTFEVEDRQGNKTTLTRAVRVDNTPNIASFGSDVLIQAGQSAALTWEAANYLSLSIDNGVGNLASASGSASVSPADTTIYTLTATRSNSFGQTFTNTAQVTVTVNHNPVFVEHTTPALGDDPSDGVTISWNQSDSDGDTQTGMVNVYAGAGCSGSVVATQTSTTGSVNVSGLDPRTDYSYTVSITDGLGGSASGACYSFTTSDTGLVGWWRFEDDTTDSSGKGYDGTFSGDDDGDLSNNFLGGVPAGQALEFDGADDYINVSDPTDGSLDFGTGDFSLSFWFKGTEFNRGILFKKPSTANDSPGWETYISSSLTLTTRVAGGSAQANPSGVTFVNDDIWHHGVIVRSQDNLFLYVDGNRESSVSGVDDLDVSNDEPLNIGRYVDRRPVNPGSWGYAYWQGLLDEIALYNRALTAAEIRDNCQRNDPSTGSGQVPTCAEDGIPDLVAPEQDALVSPAQIVFSWENTDAAGQTANYYQLCFSTDEIAVNGTGCPRERIISAADGTSYTHYLSREDSAYDVYFWKVRTCYDSAGTDCTPYTSSWSFETGDMRVTSTAGINEDYVDLEWNGDRDEYALVWRGVSLGSRVTFTRLGPDGSSLQAGQDVNAGAQTISATNLVWNGSNYGICWDGRGISAPDDTSEIFFELVPAEGISTSVADTQLTSAAGSSADPLIVWTGAEFGITWRDGRSGVGEIYFMRVDADGNKIGGDLQVSTSSGVSLHSFVWADGEFGVAWNESADGGDQLFFTRIDASGNLIPGSERQITTFGTNQMPSLVWTGTEYGLVWVYGATPTSMRFIRLDAAGNVLGEVEELETIYDFNGTYAPRMVWTGREFGIAFVDGDGVQANGRGHTNPEIYFLRLDATGAPIASGSRVSIGTDALRYPSLVWNGTDYGVAWVNTSGDVEIYFATIMGPR